MSLKKYCLVDMIILAIVGIVTEAIGCYLLNSFMPWIIPMFVSNMLITFLAIMRWGIIGLIVSPIMSVTAYLTNTFWILHNDLVEYQLVPHLITMIIANLSPVILLAFKNKENFKMFSTRIISYLSTFLLFVLIAALLEFIYTKNLPWTIFKIFTDSLMSFVIFVVISEVLAHQSILVNVKSEMLNRKKDEIYEDKYYEDKK